MEQINIFEIDEEQIPLIQELTRNVWPQTYRPIISESQIEFMLEMMYSTASLQKQIRDGHHFLVIEYAGEPVGFCSYAQVNDSTTFKLHKIYLLPEKQDLGLGKCLLLKVINAVKLKGADHLILQVNRANKKAIAFYERNGFVIEQVADFDIGNGFQMNDYIMGIQL